jgi:hypothetical protein
MAVSVATLIPRVRRLLEDRPFEDYLTANIALASTATMTVNSPTAWATGNVAEFPDGDQALLRSGTSNPLSIKRGHNGTTATTHTANDVILKDPRFSYDQIDQAIRRVVDTDLWPWVWVVSTAAVTPVTGTTHYLAGATVVDIISAVQKSGTTDWKHYGHKGSGLRIQLRRGLPSADFATGKAYYIPSFDNTTNNITVTFRAIVTTDTIEDGAMADVVVLFTAARLLEAKDIPRTGEDVSQSETGVPPASTLRTGAYFREQAEGARWKHHLYLLQTNPLPRNWVT